jgi:TetR/AcrR family transcriptional repressor of mexCD-oprJ operon
VPEGMAQEPITDHRRATAERNVEAILDAVERLLEARKPLSIAAVAAAAGVSRVTVYAHFENLTELVEAVVARSVSHATAAIAATAPGDGTAIEALERLLQHGWRQLDRRDAVARAAAEHVPSERLRRQHAPMLEVVQELVARGRDEGAFRADLPAAWLVTTFYALIHAAGDDVRAGRVAADDALPILATTVRDVFTGPAERRRTGRSPRRSKPSGARR